MSRGSRVFLIAAAVLLVGALAAAGYVVMTQGEEATVEPEPDTAQSPPMHESRAPLTGLPLTDPAAAERPAVAIKISDVQQAHPQAGVEDADLVFVEPVGPSYTRLAAVFHSQLPESVGPVRSVRPMDAPLLSPLAPVFGHTMGAEWVIRYVENQGDLDSHGSMEVPRDAGRTVYAPEPGRPAPDNIFVDPADLLALSERDTPPLEYFLHADALEGTSALRRGEPAARFVIDYGANWAVTWTWSTQSDTYERSEPWGPRTTVAGDRVTAENVIVMAVESQVEKLAEGAGAAVPVLQLVDASGPFRAYTGGHVIEGTWSKGGVQSGLELTTTEGLPLALAPGRTWIEMPAALP